MATAEIIIVQQTVGGYPTYFIAGSPKRDEHGLLVYRKESTEMQRSEAVEYAALRSAQRAAEKEEEL